MARVHFFKCSEMLHKSEMSELAKQIETALAVKGFANDSVIITTLDYQGSSEEKYGGL